MKVQPETNPEPMSEVAQFGERLRAGAALLPHLGPVAVGTSPKSLELQIDKAALYRFSRDSEAEIHVPLLIVYALVNRPYMTDLEPGRSLTRRLLAAGLDVYLVDWGYPDARDRNLSLGDYVLRYLDKFVDYIQSKHDVERINLLGICQGGTLSLCYTALNPQKIRNLVTMVTPVDFHTEDNLLSKWVRRIDVDLMVDTLGNIPGEFLNWMFAALKPARQAGGKLFDLVEILDDRGRVETFLRMEKWINDSPAQAGEAFRQFAKGLFQENRLVAGEFEIEGRPVRLEDITAPVLNIYANQDHIVPPSSSRALAKLVGSSDYSEFAFDGGHIGIYVSGKAQKVIAPRIAGWLAERSQTDTKRAPEQR